MTTTRGLCGVPSAVLQVRGVERHAARLVCDGYLPRAGEEVDEDDAAPTPAARRQRRHRERRRRGIVVAHAEVPVQMVDALVNEGDLAEIDTTDPWALGSALVDAVRKLRERYVET